MRSNSRYVLTLITVVVVLWSLRIVTRADGQLVPGRNINLNPGVADQFVGDIYRQRQVEAKIVCTIPQHCAVISNDYRTVDMTADAAVSGFGEGNASAASRALGALARVLGIGRHADGAHRAAVPDAWLGLYRTSNLEDWLNGLVPGFPLDSSPLAARQPWWQAGLSAASDGDLATDGTYIYGVGMFFIRGGVGSMIGGFRLTDFNDESAMPIRWSPGFERMIDRRDVTSNVALLDLPSIQVDPTPRGDSAPGCGHIYAGYTAFTGTTGDSSIKFVRSTDCGASYSTPISLNVLPVTQTPIFRKNQRVVFAVNPKAGTPLTTGGGTVYAVWRTFSPDLIAGTASFDYGKTWLPPIPYSVLNGITTICAYDQPTVGSSNDLGLPSNDTARAVAFPSITIDSNGKIYLAWSERVDTSGNPVQGNACTTTLQPKIVLTTSTTGGLTWTPRKAIDKGVRCETTVAADGSRPGGLDQSAPNGTTCPSGTIARASGPQIQPVINHNAGKVLLTFSEGRGGLNTSAGPSKGFHSGRDRQMDVRAAQIDPATNALLSTVQASVYTYSSATNDVKARDGAVNPPGSKAVNLPYLLQYSMGTNPFKGDHDGLAGAEPVVWDSPAHAPTGADVPGTRFLSVWGGDNRESFFPSGDLFGNWTFYQDAVNFPNSCNAGIRNSNDYLSSIGSATEAFVHQSFKPAPTGANTLLQRSWVVTVRNRRNVIQLYKFALDERNGNNGSFDQRFDQTTNPVDVNVIGNTPTDPFCTAGQTYPVCTAYRQILPYSSMTFTVFGRISDPSIGGPIRVNIFEAALNGSGTAVANESLASIVRLNPNPNNPSASLADATAASSEFHDPAVTGPSVTTNATPGPGNPGPGNPTLSFPGPGNPGPGNPGPGNPGPGNPGPGNAGFGDYTDYTFQVTAPGANTISQFASFANIPQAVDNSHFVQMIITRSHQVPTIQTVAANCAPAERTEDELISLINLKSVADLAVPGPGNPGPGNPGPGNPGPGNPGPGNTTAQNPGPGNPGPGNNTFAVSPTNTPLVGTAASAMFLATAVANASATAVSDQASDLAPDGTLTSRLQADKVFVTLRFHHCDASTGCAYNGRTYTQDTAATETVPRTPTVGSDSLIVLSVTPAAGNNNNNVITPPTAVFIAPDLLVSAPDVLTTTPTQGTAGSQATVGAFTISNAGSADAGAFSYRYLLVPLAGTPVALTDSIPVSTGETGVSIAAGGSRQIGPQDVTIPAGSALGPYSIRIVVDDTNAIRESNETNNSKDASFTVVDTNRIAVWGDSTDPGGNGIVAFINGIPGFSATVITTANLESPGFLSGFNAVYVTRVGASFGTGLSATAAGNVKGYVGAGPVVLFVNDWDDNLPTSNVGDLRDDQTSQLIANAIMRAARRHGYVGEFNGAVMALTTNSNGFSALDLIPGSAGVLGSIACQDVSITTAGTVIQGSVPSPFHPTDASCFSAVTTGVPTASIWTTYANGQTAIIGR